jgi:hypothetical protein
MLAHGECAPPRLLSVGWVPHQAMISERDHGRGIVGPPL